MGSQARTEFDDPESKNPKRRLSSNKSEDGRKKSRYTNPDIQEDYDETEGLHSDHDEDEISEEEFSAEFRGGGGGVTGVGKSNDGIFAKVDYFSEENM